MLNSEIGHHLLEERLRRAQRERTAASIVKASSPRLVQRLSALFGSVRASEQVKAPAPGTSSPPPGRGSAVFTLTWGFQKPALGHVLELRIEHPGRLLVHRS